MLSIAACTRTEPYEFQGSKLEGDNPAYPIEAQNRDGTAFNMAEHTGDFVLLNFGYTSCPDICPLTLAQLANFYETLSPEAREQIDVAFVTVDPERDTPERLDSYIDAFEEDFYGLYIGDQAELEQVKAAYGVFSEKRFPDGDESDPNYFVDHTGGVYVIGPDGTFELFFPHDASAEMMAADMEQLIKMQ